MEIFLAVILIIVGGILFGIFIGIIGSALKELISKRKLIRNAVKVMGGERKNQTINPEGKIIDVNKFRLRDEKNNEIIISWENLPKSRFEKKENNKKRKKK